MPLATQDDVRDALRRVLTDSEEEWADSLILEAGDLVAGYLHPYTIPADVPEPITRVVAGMVAAGVLRGDMPVSHWDTRSDAFLLDDHLIIRSEGRGSARLAGIDRVARRDVYPGRLVRRVLACCDDGRPLNPAVRIHRRGCRGKYQE